METAPCRARRGAQGSAGRRYPACAAYFEPEPELEEPPELPLEPLEPEPPEDEPLEELMPLEPLEPLEPLAPEDWSPPPFWQAATDMLRAAATNNTFDAFVSSFIVVPFKEKLTRACT